MRRLFTRIIAKGQRGITGLETAIILIAFVVVASVFSYTILSAGIFSSEKAREGIDSGLSNSSSAMSIVGKVIATDTDQNGTVDQVIFSLASVLGQEANIDLSVTTDTDSDGVLDDETTKVHTTVISYFDRDNTIADVAWTKIGLGRNDGDDILEAGEKFQITVDLGGLPTSNPVQSYDTFTIEVKPAAGGPVIFSKTIPPLTSRVMTLN